MYSLETEYFSLFRRGLVHYTMKAWDVAVCGVITWWRRGQVSGMFLMFICCLVKQLLLSLLGRLSDFWYKCF